MAECYRIEYVDGAGRHFAYKWGETPELALGALKKSHGSKGGMYAAAYSDPVLSRPAPFTDEGRAANRRFWEKHGGEITAPAVEVVEIESEPIEVTEYEAVTSA